MSELSEGLEGAEVQVHQHVVAQVEAEQPGQGQTGDRLERSVGQPEVRQSLGVVEQLLEIGSDRIVGQIQGQQGAEAHEDVVRQDGESVMGEGQGDQLQCVGEHRGVQVLDLVEREVEISHGLGDISQGSIGHHLDKII